MRLPHPETIPLRALAIASLVANIGIVVTGGAVRLTGSGLGCPTWPRCTDESWTPHGAMGVHGVIEFGNRTLTGVLVVVAILTWIAAMRDQPRRPGVRLLATLLAFGIPLQAVVGGITVLTDLNPVWVAPHLMLSMVLVVGSTLLVRRASEPGGAVSASVPQPLRVLAWLTFGWTFVVLYVGALVTGSGPHAGDAQAIRTGFDTQAISQLHADVVCVLIGLTIGLLFGFRAVRAPRRAQRAVVWLLAAELGQGLVGIVQYVTDLPVILVGIHMLGAALTIAAATAVALSTRDRAELAAAA
ncbi:COX15/CtaA family protein [Flindersiella endophytica]